MSNLYDGHDSIIYPDTIDARIKRLKALAADFALNEDGLAELEACVKFRQDVCDVLDEHNWIDSPGFIADTYFAKYADDRAADLYGREVVDLPYWDQDAFENDHRYGFTEFAFDGVTYLVDKDW